MKPMRVSPQQVAGSAQTLAGCAQDLNDAVNALVATVTTGNPWGGDEAGSVFGEAYTQVLGHALQVLGSHVDLLATAAVGLGELADSVSGADQSQAQRFTSLGSRLGG